MPTSTLTFEEGEGILVGSHGEHDVVYEEGVEVTDSGQSTLTFEEGTGLGGVADALYFVTGDYDATAFDSALSAIESQISGSAVFADATQTDLDTALSNGNYGVLVCRFGGDQGGPLSTSEESAAADFWQSNGRMAVFAEDNIGGDNSQRGTYAEDLCNAVFGSNIFDTNDVNDPTGQGGEGCFDPGGASPWFDGVSSLYFRGSELSYGGDASPASIISVASSEFEQFAQLENSTGRAYFDGGEARFRDFGVGQCPDGQTYLDNVFDWIVNGT